ncbi:mitochondrial import inner membrane translocase subunit TIM44 [Copidosoma floridanum]|uniref:mitochondrial import inner membrane translocase subunit TIM44 n=1 Tax=Copidosoma floridanum TaxID=29053 RepID=UPI0006C9C33C|nr:mitochondrial import inner membrane translocase subunit TIM44 [Copidosoma floridanum]
MFQNFSACKSSLSVVTRSAHARTKFNIFYQNSLVTRFSLVCIHQNQNAGIRDQPCRFYSNARPGFISKFLDNIKQEMQKNKEMKESLKKFREEAEKLEHSEALQSARKKFHSVESEASKSSEALKGRIEEFSKKFEEVLQETSKTEMGKKMGALTDEISKAAKEADKFFTQKGEALGKSNAFQTISQTAEAVKKELDSQGIEGKVYSAPKVLRKRKEVGDISSDKQVEANLDATGVELHKDSKFYQSWQNFKDKNPYVNKVLDWKIKYEESENPVVRASRLLTDKVTDIVGGMFQKTELSETLTEICKLDPNFDKVKFLKDCETDIIPNVLEAWMRGNLEVLKDWCHEAPYNVISQPIQQALKMGYRLDNKILDIENVDLLMGKMMDQGPVLAINFTCQQIMCIRDAKSNVVEGDPDKILRVNYVWVLCRDPTELNPKSAWRLLEAGASSTEQFV